MPAVAPRPPKPTDLSDSPLYMLAVLYSARKSKDRALEQVTRKRLAKLGVRLIFDDDAIPDAPPESAEGSPRA